jgi:tRNA(Ile)-lysidine synthase
MAAMPEVKKFAGGYLLRPLLGLRRRELELYAEQQQLAYIHDPSNDDSRFDRNFLRSEVVPVLQQRWPSLVPTLLRSAQQQAEAAELLDVLAAQDMAQCMGSSPDGLALVGLRSLAENRQRNVLRYWLRQRAVSMPHRRKLNEILRTMLTAADDRQPHIDWPGGEVRRYRGELYASASVLPPVPSAQPWDLQAELELPAGLGYLSAYPGLGTGLDLGRLASAPVSVRFRQGGENCLPAGRGQHHSLKKLFQESAIPPWQRERIPLLYIGEELAQIMGICICEPFKAAAGQPAVNIEWQQNCSSS